MKNNILTLALLIISSSIFAQISKVNYGVKFNPTTCNYDCYMKAVEGYTVSDRDRIQFNSQLTLVVPNSTKISVEESYAPFLDNKSGRSNTVSQWYVTNLAESPGSLKGYDVYSLSPTTVPTAFYNDIERGQEVILFSISAFPMLDCGQGLRLFDHNIDPTSDEAGMGGRNFDNGFTIGGINQVYIGNEPIIYPTKPSIQNLNVSNNNVTFDVINEHSSCQSELSYKWISENGNVVGTSKAFPNTLAKGIYSLEVQDNLGCSDKVTFNTKSNSSTVNTELENEVAGGDELSGTKFISVFPNPAKNFINVSINTKLLTGDIKGSIFDSNGKQVMKNVINTTLDGQKDYNTTIVINLPSGIYTLGVDNNSNRVINKKLIIVE